MQLAEIVNTCSHPKVAEAALASIGAPLRERMAAIAADRDMEAGAFAADLVRRYAQDADAGEWRVLAASINHADMPVLDGLRHILETMTSRRDGTRRLPRPGSPSGRAFRSAA